MTEPTEPHENLSKALGEMSHDLHQAHAVLNSGGEAGSVRSLLRAVATRATNLAASLDPQSEGEPPPDPPDAADGPHSSAQLQAWMDEEGSQAVAEELTAPRDAADARADEVAMLRRRYRRLLDALVFECRESLERAGTRSPALDRHLVNLRAYWDLDHGNRP